MKVQRKRAPVATNKSNFSSRIFSVAEVPVELKVLLYGRSGTGKTTFIGTAPKPILVLDVREKGTVSLRKTPEVFMSAITTWAELEEAYWFLASGDHKFKTVAIDTITQLQDLALTEVKGGEGGMTSRKAWGDAASLLKTWVVNFRDLPMNVIFTAQDRQTGGDEGDLDDEGTILPEVGPYVMPSVAKVLNAATGIIGQTFIREREKKIKVAGKEKVKTIVEYCMRVGPHARYITKFRKDPSYGGDQVPSFLVSPTFEDMLNLTLGGEEE